MTIVDLVVLAFVGGAIVHGIRAGASVQIASFAGFWGGLAVGAALAPRFSSFATSPAARLAIALVVLFGTPAVLSAVARVAAMRLLSTIRVPGVVQIDRSLGAVVGAGATLVATWLIASMIATVPLPQLTQPLQRSAILRAMDKIMPPAPQVFSRIQRVLDPAGFPNVFAQFEPSPAAPLPLPSDPAIRAAVARAGPSTVKIVGEACGEIISGSGFVVAPGEVVTNAHVVAGESTQTVNDRSGSHPSFVVAFDPKMDVAVLRVSGLRDPVLSITSAIVPRGTKGAALGYPGGGPFHVSPSVVLREEPAVGRDIYGTGLTTRDVYEIDADIRPGNSGGPLVDTRGTVDGVVFARSSSTSGVGYALTGAEVSSRVRSAGATRVSTGPCAAG